MSGYLDSCKYNYYLRHPPVLDPSHFFVDPIGHPLEAEHSIQESSSVDGSVEAHTVAFEATKEEVPEEIPTSQELLSIHQTNDQVSCF
jgi:hypothetical protein